MKQRDRVKLVEDPIVSYLVSYLVACLVAGLVACSSSQWVAAWATSPEPVDPDEPAFVLADTTLRQIVRVSTGGPQLRLRLSNAYGTSALALSSVHVAVHAAGSAIRPETDREVSFGGAATVVIPPGGISISDPVALEVTPLTELAISIRGASSAKAAAAEHAHAQATAYLGPADAIAAPDFTARATATSWHIIVGVDVDARATRTIVAFGDSVTDGMKSTIDANRRWPDLLAERIAGRHRAVVAAGISGNKLLGELVGEAGLARFDRDVLAQPGIGYVIVAIGINDLGAFDDAPGAKAEQLIAGYRDLIARAHARGVQAIGATLIPFAGARMFTPDGDAQRAAVNAWIRTPGRFDAVIDFDAALRDPAKPDRLRPDFDSGDHAHPDDAGYRAMADAIDLSIFD